MKVPQWVIDAAENVSSVASNAWRGLPQRARDVLVGAAFGLVIGLALGAAWAR